MLVDCGATHNFISTKLVEKLGLDIVFVTIEGYGVVMGTGISVQGKGVCKEIVLSLPEFKIVKDFLPYLGSSDVILGMQWFRNLGWDAHELAVPCSEIQVGWFVGNIAKGTRVA